MISPTSLQIARINLESIENDLPPIKLNSSVVTEGANMRYRDNALEAFDGYKKIYSTISFSPTYAFSVQRPTEHVWILAGPAKVVTISSSGTETDLTPVGGVTSTQDDNWVGGVLNGLPFFGCKLNNPVYWDGNTSNNVADLPGWPAGTSAACFRPYKNFIIALDVDDAGGSNPNMIKWSESADAGSVPGSWDETDPIKNAGEVLLGDQEGRLIDCLPLGGDNIVYKNNSTYIMQFIGGQFIFSFREIFHTSGILTQNCVVEVENKHVVLTKQDIIIHDGRTIQSIADNRVKKFIFEQMNTDKLHNSYVVHYPKNYEVWFCVPFGNATLPEMAVVWNYRHDKFGLRDLPGSPHIARGIIEFTDDELVWSTDTENWNEDISIWNQQFAKGSPQELVMISGTELFQLNTGVTDDTVVIDGYVEKQSMVVDPEAKNVIFLRSIIPFISAEIGTTVHISIGSQFFLTDNIEWRSPKPFVIGSQDRLDCMIKGRYISIKIRGSNDTIWRVEEVGLEYSVNERY